MTVRTREIYHSANGDRRLLARNPETGAIAPWAQRVIDRLNTYTEISPSGTGLHNIVALTRPLPEDGAHKHGGKDQNWEIGIYDRTSPRYFCATGVIVDGRNSLDREAVISSGLEYIGIGR